MRDALVTIVTRFGLAVLIFGTDIVLARLLGPAAKGRFALILLYSQLAAVVAGWGMDQALAVVAARDLKSARQGFANSVTWSLVVGGAAVLASCLAYGLPTVGRPHGPLAALIPNLSGGQFVFAALALPGELFFAVGLFTLLGRKRVVAWSVIRVLRRGVLLVLIVAAAAIDRLDLDIAIVLNLVALATTAAAIAYVAWKDHAASVRPSGTLLVEELRFGSRAIVGTIAERLQFRADSFLVNAIVGVRATGVYSVTSGLAETLWYVPNSLGTVMFSRAVDPTADAGRVAAVLTRTTIAVTAVTAIPAFILGPRVVRLVYGSQFSDAGVALRLILPGIVAYSVVAVLSRYIVGRGRPGVGTFILLAGLGANIVCNLFLIPRFGIDGAAASSSISCVLTAILTLLVFRRISGRGWVETLIIRRSDLAALAATAMAILGRLRGRSLGPIRLGGGDEAAEQVIGEREPGEER
ncbi:MAG TPA: polysaccharide biosynthesis C-terminal domain-containing protein [Candidatus Acidoferrum sp.]|nr:polysaccharide biosynthesis C-terminal domain-containing protein [Candidatus Acidoferrum sp.]